MRVAMRLAKRLNRRLRGFLPYQGLEFLALQHAQHIPHPVSAFRMARPGIMRQSRRMRKQRDTHGSSTLRFSEKLNPPRLSPAAISAWPDTLLKSLKSTTEAGSVASTRSFSPGAIPRNARAARSTGKGHF